MMKMMKRKKKHGDGDNIELGDLVVLAASDIWCSLDPNDLRTVGIRPGQVCLVIGNKDYEFSFSNERWWRVLAPNGRAGYVVPGLMKRV